MNNGKDLQTFSISEYKGMLVQNCLWKSKHALEDGLKNEMKSQVLNRLYYAVFYSVLALGYNDEFVTSKHLPLMHWFRKRYIFENKIFDSRMNDIYKAAIAYCEEFENFDSVTGITMEQLNNLTNDVEYFTKQVEKYLTVHTN